jgi:hypothetical protein
LHSPGECKRTDTRCLDIHEDEELDEAQLAVWVNQASQLPGERCEREVASGVRGVSGRQVTSPQAHESRGKETAGDLLAGRRGYLVASPVNALADERNGPLID